jgi:hypothetical protein
LWLIGSKGIPSVDMERLRQRWAALTPNQRSELDLAGVRAPAQLAALYLTDVGDPPAGISSTRAWTDDRPYVRPIWEPPIPSGVVSGNPEVSAAALGRLLQEQGPRLLGATEEERAAVQERRSMLQGMALKGTAMGPFRFLGTPAAIPAP